MISKGQQRRSVCVTVPIHASLAALTLWDHLLLYAVLLENGWDDFFGNTQSLLRNTTPNQNKISAECWNFHELGKRSHTQRCWAPFVPQEEAVSIWSREHSVQAEEMSCSALCCAESKRQLGLDVWLKSLFLSCSTSRHKCWWSSWPTLPEGWSTSAARTSSTETSLLATACEHNLRFHFFYSLGS